MASTLFKGKTAFISGGSRGIGLSIGLRLAREGANVVIAAKTATPHPKLPGTIYTAVEEIEKAGGKGLPIVLDIRNAEAVEKAIQHTVDTFGGLDILINNASAISLTKTQDTSVKTYDLMNSINARGTWLVSKYAIPHLLKSSSHDRNPHILTLSPPLRGNLLEQHFSTSTAYAMAKYGMSLATLGLAGELRGKVGVNALWPLTLIDTEAIRLVSGEETRSQARSPSIVAETALAMLSKDGREYTGNFEIDELFLRKEMGYTNETLAQFSSCDQEDLLDDLFLPDWIKPEIEKLRSSKL